MRLRVRKTFIFFRRLIFLESGAGFVRADLAIVRVRIMTVETYAGCQRTQLD